jgi:hypothetical protein
MIRLILSLLLLEDAQGGGGGINRCSLITVIEDHGISVILEDREALASGRQRGRERREQGARQGMARWPDGGGRAVVVGLKWGTKTMVPG